MRMSETQLHVMLMERPCIVDDWKDYFGKYEIDELETKICIKFCRVYKRFNKSDATELAKDASIHGIRGNGLSSCMLRKL